MVQEQQLTRVVTLSLPSSFASLLLLLLLLLEGKQENTLPAAGGPAKGRICSTNSDDSSTFSTTNMPFFCQTAAQRVVVYRLFCVRLLFSARTAGEEQQEQLAALQHQDGDCLSFPHQEAVVMIVVAIHRRVRA